MIHFAYPNVRSVKQYIGCGRYTVADDIPGEEYNLAEPDSPHITEIRAVAENMVPDTIVSTLQIYERRDEPDNNYRGESLDLAYLLSYINTAYPLKKDVFAEKSFDIWCTGAVDIKEMQNPWLKAMDNQQFELKLEAFLSEKNTDRFFIVPNANISNQKKKLQNLGVDVLSLNEISNQSLKNTNKIVLAIGPNDVPSLVNHLFEVPEHLVLTNTAGINNRYVSIRPRETYGEPDKIVSSMELEGLSEYNISQMTLGQIGTILKLVESGIREDLDNAEAYFVRGNSYHQREEYKHAIIDYDKAIELDSNYADAYEKRGICYRILGNCDQAVDDYDTALRLRQAWSHHARAVAFYYKDDYKNALNEVDMSIQINPNYNKAYMLRGGLREKNKDYENALADYSKAIELDPTCLLSHFSRGRYYQRLGEHDKALADYNKAIDLDPVDKDTYNNRGNCYKRLGDYENALADYSKAIELDPTFQYAYNNRGNCYKRLGEYGNALPDFDKAIELNPSYKYAYFNRGYCYKRLGDYENALADYSKAIELDPNYRLALSNIAWLLSTCPIEEYRDGIKAIEYARRAIELISSDKAYRKEFSLFDTLAAAFAESGNFKDAIATQEQAIDLLNKTSETPGLEERDQYIERLELYKAHQPWHKM